MKRTKKRQTVVLALSVLALTLIAPWVFGQAPDPLTELRRQSDHRPCQIILVQSMNRLVSLRRSLLQCGNEVQSPLFSHSRRYDPEKYFAKIHAH